MASIDTAFFFRNSSPSIPHSCVDEISAAPPHSALPSLLNHSITDDFSQNFFPSFSNTNAPLTPAPTSDEFEPFIFNDEELKLSLKQEDSNNFSFNNSVPTGLPSPPNSTFSDLSSPRNGNLTESGLVSDDTLSSPEQGFVPMLDSDVFGKMSTESGVATWVTTMGAQDYFQQPQHTQDDLALYVKFEDGERQVEQENSDLARPALSPPADSGSTPPKSDSPEAQPPMAKPPKKSSSTRPPRTLECFNCHVTKTPLWRRTPDRQHSLCNACGLYYKQYNTHRPLHIRHKHNGFALGSGANARASAAPYTLPNKVATPVAQQSLQQYLACNTPMGLTSGAVADLSAKINMYNASATRCVNCLQTQTPLWRKNEKGEPICNACGLYAKLHHKDRPVGMKKTSIQRRRRDWSAGITLPNDMNVLGNTQHQVLSPLAAKTKMALSQGFDLSTNCSLDVPSADSTIPNFQQQAGAAQLLKQQQSGVQRGEFDDMRFRSLLARMSQAQMQNFLILLEKRCDTVRAALERLNEQQQVVQNAAVQNTNAIIVKGSADEESMNEDFIENKNENDSAAPAGNGEF